MVTITYIINTQQSKIFLEISFSNKCRNGGKRKIAKMIAKINVIAYSP